MTPWQITLAFFILGAVIADIIYTRQMIAAARRHIEQTRRMLRAMGYEDPGEDDAE